MKLSLAPLSVLLLASVAHALPNDPKALQARAEIPGAAAGNAVGEITDRVSGLIKDAQGPKDDWEEKEKLLKTLAENRKIVVDRLLHAQEVQSDAEAKVKDVNYKFDNAARDVRELVRELTGLSNEKIVLEKRLNATTKAFDDAGKAKEQIRLELSEATAEKNEAHVDAFELRKAIAKIDETIENLD